MIPGPGARAHSMRCRWILLRSVAGTACASHPDAHNFFAALRRSTNHLFIKNGHYGATATVTHHDHRRSIGIDFSYGGCLYCIFRPWSNRTTGYLKVAAEWGAENVYDISQLPQENVIVEGRLFSAMPPIVRVDYGLHLDIRNTGRYDEQIIKVGYLLRGGLKGEFQSPDPQDIKNFPTEIIVRVPFDVPAGQSKRMFWVLNDEELQKSGEATRVWLETARETIRTKIHGGLPAP